MTEEEYIRVSNLATLRLVLAGLREVHKAEPVDVSKLEAMKGTIDKWLQELHELAAEEEGE